MSLGLGFELWFVVGCFIADEYFFVGNVFGDWIWKSGGVNLEDWVELIWRIGCGDDFVLAEGVFTRARMRAPILEFCFFAVTSVTADGIEKTSSPQKNNVSFCGKWRVVLWKVTGCFGLEVEKLFWGWCFGEFLGWSSSVKVWQYLDFASVVSVNNCCIIIYVVCVTLVTAKK